MTQPDISAMLSIPAILILLGSATLFLFQKKGKEGSAEIIIGTAMMAVAILGRFFLYYYSTNSQYQFESQLEKYYAISDFIGHFFPIGLLFMSIGFARFTKLLSHIRRRNHV